MARKRLIEDPPPATSSSEEEETDDEEEEQHGTVETRQNGVGEKQNNVEDSSEDDDDDDEEEDDEDDHEEVGKKKPDLPSKPAKPFSESDSDDESAGPESSQPQSPSLSDFTIKPISPKRKPGLKLEQPKKEKDAEDKKAKRGAGPATGGSRIWSDEDEIAILNGMIEYQNKKAKSPSADTSDFYGFVKESLHFNASANQFSDKFKRLKKKYYTDVGKKENGKDEIFSRPHDLKCVELAKKIWGAGGIDVGSKSNASKKSGKNVVGGGDIDVGSKSNASKKSGKGVIGGGGGGGGITLALPKMGRGEVTGKEKEVSVKKAKRGSSEEVNGEGKKGNVKRQKRALNEEADGGEEGNVKREKKGWTEEANGEGKGKGGEKVKMKMVLSEEVNGEGKRKGGKMEKQAENEELNGGEDVSVKKQNKAVNEEMNGEEKGREDWWVKYPFLRTSLQAEELSQDVKERAMVMLGKVPEEKLVELEREWRSLMNAKLEFFVKEKDLTAKLMKLALDVLKSQD